MSLATELPERSNGDDIIAGWFNTIRTLLIGFIGTESLKQTTFAGASGQSGTTVTGLIFDKTVTRRVDVKTTIVTATLFGGYDFTLFYNDTVWSIHDKDAVKDDTGITFDVNTSTGQVIYDSG